MEDKQIIKLFFARADEAIQALRVRFGNTLYKIAMNILGNHHDAEETTNDTYLAIWNAIPPKEPDPFVRLEVRKFAIALFCIKYY